MAKRIVIVEDEQAILENYTQFLTRHGYEVTGYSDKNSALSALDIRLPDLVILDVGLGAEPEAGFDLCRELRAKSKTLPIFFLTALDSEFDTISGLRLGADDYLTKDISMHHLLARISAMFRRIEADSRELTKEDQFSRGDLFVDGDRVAVFWKELKVDLTLTEFWMVYALAVKPGHVKSREQLMSEAKTFVDDSTVTSHVKRIRRKFQEVDASFDEIDTVYGLGYRWKSH
jgi:two-component system, OmpR family, response regulator